MGFDNVLIYLAAGRFSASRSMPRPVTYVTSLSDSQHCASPSIRP